MREMMRVSVIAPVLNEVDFIGYSIMSCIDYVHEFIYALDEASNDGTRELLHSLSERYPDKIKIIDFPNFHPSDQKAYNRAFNACIELSTGDACWFLHPDMIATNPKMISFLEDGPLAWFTHMTSYAGDFHTQITKGRVEEWKNIHTKKFGLHYFGAYGSQNEDFYHSDITGNAYKHFGIEFSKYPYRVNDSGISINHYCECKPYARRLEKMKHCLRTLLPGADELAISDKAYQHPRVTLEPSSSLFGRFEFTETDRPIPDVFAKYAPEFEPFKKEEVVTCK